MKQSQRRDRLDYNYALRSFLGYLEGTSKAQHTLKSYKSDLKTFKDFLDKGLGSEPVGLHQIQKSDLDRYPEFLKTLGLGSNSRRRKLMTVRKWLTYLRIRKQISIDVGKKIPAPYKLEKVPQVVPYLKLVEQIKSLPEDTLADRRNKMLFWLMAHTGALVSEIVVLKKGNFKASDKTLWIGGKNERTLSLESDFAHALEKYVSQLDGDPLFSGQHRSMALHPEGVAITTRAVELFVRHYASKLAPPGTDPAWIVPRIFRHSVVLYWHQSGLDDLQIKERLGLKSMYAFKVYQALFKQDSKEILT